MSDKLIPEHIDPYRFAEQGLSLDGTLKIKDMQRISAHALPQDGTVKVDLQFGKDEQKSTFLKGHLETKLTLQCQRCLEPFVYEIISDFVLGVVDTLEDADALPEHYEPAITQEGNLALRDLIEDEIILNMPIISRHAPEECKVRMPYIESEPEQGKGTNPFHVLQSLKEKHK